MQTFKIGPDGIAQIKKKSLLRAILFSLIAVTLGITIAVINARGVTIDISTFIPMLILVPIVLGFSFWRGLKQLNAMMKSYQLTISENTIVREQLNTPDIFIYHAEVLEIVQHKNGNLSIKGSRNNGTIIIPAQIDNYTQLQTTLQEIHPISTKGKHPALRVLQYLLAFAGIAPMIGVYVSNNKVVVGIAGTLFTALMTWFLITAQRDKNLDRKTKNWAWVVLLVMASVIAVTIMKLTAPALLS